MTEHQKKQLAEAIKSLHDAKESLECIGTVKDTKADSRIDDYHSEVESLITRLEMERDEEYEG